MTGARNAAAASTRRLLIISSSSSAMGGGEAYLEHVVRAANGTFQTVLLASSDRYMDDWCNRWADLGCQILRVPYRHTYRRPLRSLGATIDVRTQKRILTLTRAVEPTLIHINQQTPADALDLVRALVRAKRPFVGTIHIPLSSADTGEHFSSLRDRLTERTYERFPYPKVFVSEWAREHFETRFPSHAWLNKVCHNMATAATRDNAEGTAAHRTLAAPTVLFVGRFTRQKAPDVFLRAFLKLTEHTTAHAVMLGSGPLLPAIRALASDIQLPSTVQLPGYVDSEPYLRQADLLVSTALFEGQPLALLEGLAHSTPLVVSDIPGHRDIFRLADPPPGILVPKSDPDAFARAMLDILCHPRQLSGASQAAYGLWRRHFSLEVFSARLNSLYEESLEGQLSDPTSGPANE